MRATLTIARGDEKGKVFEIDEPGVFALGRSNNINFKVEDTSISRKHCEIEFDGQFFWLSDCESSNGTFVNKRRISKYLMYDGDVIRIGRTRLVFGLLNEDPDDKPEEP